MVPKRPALPLGQFQGLYGMYEESLKERFVLQTESPLWRMDILKYYSAGKRARLLFTPHDNIPGQEFNQRNSGQN